MNHEQLLDVVKLIRTARPNQQMTKDAIEGYWTWLKDLDVNDAKAATMAELRKTDFLPLPDRIASAVHEARLQLPDPESVIGEILGLVQAIGSYGDPLKSASPLAAAVIDNYGWMAICDMTPETRGTVLAQLRDRARIFRSRAIEQRHLGSLGIPPPVPCPAIEHRMGPQSISDILGPPDPKSDPK